MSGVVASAAPLVASTLVVPVARLIARMMAFTVVVIMIVVVVLTLHTGFLRGGALLLGLLARKLPQRAHVVLAFNLVAAGRSKSCR